MGCASLLPLIIAAHFSRGHMHPRWRLGASAFPPTKIGLTASGLLLANTSLDLNRRYNSPMIHSGLAGACKVVHGHASGSILACYGLPSRPQTLSGRWRISEQMVLAVVACPCNSPPGDLGRASSGCHLRLLLVEGTLGVIGRQRIGHKKCS